MYCGLEPLTGETYRNKKRKQLARAFRFVFRTLDKVSLRSFADVLVHICVAVALAALLYFGQFAAR